MPLFFYDSRLNGLSFSGPALRSFPWQVELAMCEARKSMPHLHFYFLLPENSPAQTHSRGFHGIYAIKAFSDRQPSGTSCHYSWVLHSSLPLNSPGSDFGNSHFSFCILGCTQLYQEVPFCPFFQSFCFLRHFPHHFAYCSNVSMS